MRCARMASRTVVLDERLVVQQFLVAGRMTAGRLDDRGGILRRSGLDYGRLLKCVKVLNVLVAERLEHGLLEDRLLERPSRRVAGERVRRLLRLT